MVHPVSAAEQGERLLRIPAEGGVLVFDGCCGFCTRAVHALLRLDRRQKVRALPLQGQGVLGLCRLDRAAALHAVWWIGADGSRHSGAAATSAALAAVTRLPLLPIYRLPGIRQLADRSYRWVAENRRRLRGVTPHCAHEPGACVPDDEPSG